jgi:hypothetical protein
MTHIRLIHWPNGRYGLVTRLGNSLNRVDLAAAGLEADPQDLSEDQAQIIGAHMERWITDQNELAAKAERSDKARRIAASKRL